MRITVYQKPTCSTCRSVFKALKEAGVDFDAVDYYVQPLSKAKLKDLLKKMGMPAEDLLRRNEEVYKRLNLPGRKLAESEILDLMVQYPDLIQRPIVERGPRAILARPAERLKEIIPLPRQ